jgi:hypothetical protein
MFYLQKIGVEGRTGSAWKQGGWGEAGKGSRRQGGEMAQIMYAHMNKCMNN